MSTAKKTWIRGAAVAAIGMLLEEQGKLQDQIDGLEIRLRRLEALLCVADKKDSLIISGNGDVIEPDQAIIGIGSGGVAAQAAALALAASVAGLMITTEAMIGELARPEPMPHGMGEAGLM